MARTKTRKPAARTETNTAEMNRSLIGAVHSAAREVGIASTDESLPGEQTINQRRRMRLGGVDPSITTLTLTRTDGVLLWEDNIGGPTRPATNTRAQRRAAVPTGVTGKPFASGDELITQLKCERLEPSKVGSFLVGLDDKFVRSNAPATLKNLDDPYGLRVCDKMDGALKPGVRPVGKGRILLFIHGTFSNSICLFDQAAQIPKGREFLRWAATNYDQTLAFDHPTLSVSPMLNALDLARLFAESDADVDVICHSRGGLVTRWWMETFDHGRGRRRAVLTGSPLNGTSLAAPDKLRNGLSLLTNVGNALEAAGGLASTMVPFMPVVLGLLKIFTSITSAASSAPLIDAAVAMIPGLAAQSRTDNNQELLRLNQKLNLRKPEYFAIRGNFEPDAPGWKFWQYFTNAKKQLPNLAVDLLVFKGANDLVVDTASMTETPSAIPGANIYDFGKTGRVHHTNYFLQPETYDFIMTKLTKNG